MDASTECNQMTDPGPCQLEAEWHLLQVLPEDSGTWPDLAPLERTGNAQGCSGGSIVGCCPGGHQPGVNLNPFSLALWGWGGASTLNSDTLPGTTDYADLKQCQQVVSEPYLSRHRKCGG